MQTTGSLDLVSLCLLARMEYRKGLFVFSRSVYRVTLPGSGMVVIINFQSEFL